MMTQVTPFSMFRPHVLRVMMTALLLLLSGNVIAADGAKSKGATPPPAGVQAQTSQTNGPRININTAGLEELQKLPRVGAKTAQRIIEFRAENGKFAAPEELMNVKGIGEKTFAKLRPLIQI